MTPRELHRFLSNQMLSGVGISLPLKPPAIDWQLANHDSWLQTKVKLVLQSLWLINKLYFNI